MKAGRPNQILKYLVASSLIAGLTACGNNGTTTTTTTTPAPLTASALTGKYTFTASGTNTTDGDYSVAGSFTADGKGAISGAVADYSLGSGIDANVPLTGTYSVASGVATITLTDGAGLQDSYTTTLFASGGTQVSATFTKTDGTGTGTLYAPVTASFAPAGTYSFALKGEGAGVVSASGNFVAAASGTFSSGNEMYTDTNTQLTYATIPGFLYPLQANGRGQASIGGSNFGYYAASANQVVLIGLDDRALLSGTATKQ